MQYHKGMYTPTKTHQIVSLMKKTNIDLMCLSETHIATAYV